MLFTAFLPNMLFVAYPTSFTVKRVEEITENGNLDLNLYLLMFKKPRIDFNVTKDLRISEKNGHRYKGNYFCDHFIHFLLSLAHTPI